MKKELWYCPECEQMANHGCLKCRNEEVDKVIDKWFIKHEKKHKGHPLLEEDIIDLKQRLRKK